ncbi:rab GTPase [Phlegmacium glaucopus]|nr:rab GTPase [Phlegmacium glaucopus]
MAGITWHYVFKFIITGDAAVGKSSLLVQLTDQRFLANPEPTLGVEFGSKLISIPQSNPDDNKLVVKLQCWDTAGQESFRAITRSYYRGAAGCLLVYDVTSRKSFVNARSWLAEVREHADPHVSCILVGNKVDLLCEDSTSSAAGISLTSSSPPNAAGSQTGSVRSKNTATKGKVREVTYAEPNAAGSDIRSVRSKNTATKGKVREVTYAEAEQWAKEEGMLFVEASAKSGLNVEQAFVDASCDILAKIGKGVFDDDRSPGVKLLKPNTNLALDGASRSPCCAS